MLSLADNLVHGCGESSTTADLAKSTELDVPDTSLLTILTPGASSSTSLNESGFSVNMSASSVAKIMLCFLHQLLRPPLQSLRLLHQVIVPLTVVLCHTLCSLLLLTPLSQTKKVFLDHLLYHLVHQLLTPLRATTTAVCKAKRSCTNSSMSLSDGSGPSLSSLTSPTEDSSTVIIDQLPGLVHLNHYLLNTVQYVLRGIVTVITVTGLNVLVVSGHMGTVLKK